MKISHLVFCFFLVACAEAPPVYRPVAVDMPVAVPCHAPVIELPTSVLQSVPADAPLFDKVKAALIEIDQCKAYQAQAEAALAVCR